MPAVPFLKPGAIYLSELNLIKKASNDFGAEVFMVTIDGIIQIFKSASPPAR